MNAYRLVHQPSGQVVATVQQAENWWKKGWGVLGQRALPAGEGLWLPEVASVHTLFLRFSLDLLFLDRDFRALKIAPQTPPWRWLIRASGAVHTVELGAGTLAQAKLGDKWVLERVSAGRC